MGYQLDASHSAISTKLAMVIFVVIKWPGGVLFQEELSIGKSFACFLHNNNELKISRYQIDFNKNAYISLR